MSTIAELLDEGVRAYTRGDSESAERAWRGALGLDPGNERARAYLRQLQGERPDAAPSVPASPWDTGPTSGATVQISDEGNGLDLGVVEGSPEIRSVVGSLRAPGNHAGAGSVETWMTAARELFSLGDFSGSLGMIERILRVDPANPEAQDYLAQNESTLVAMYESKMGPLSHRPRLAIAPEEVLWLNLDHRAGFLLAQIDGTVNYEDLYALSGLPRLDTARILSALVTEGVIR